MRLENKKMIVLRFVLFFGVMLLLLGCVGKWNDDPNARYRGIVSESDCSKKNGYWYNNECWSNITENYHTIVPSELGVYVDNYLRAKSRSMVRINDKEYQPFSINMLPEGADTIMLIQYLQNDTMFNINIYLDSQALSTMESGKTAKVDATLVDGDIYSDSNKSIAEGQVYFTETENKENDEITTIIEGTLESTDVSDVEDVFNVYAFIDLDSVGGGYSTLSIDGDTAYLNGILGTESYIQIHNLQKYPEVKILVLQHVPGSIHDEINLHTGRLVHTLGLITYLPSDGEAYSGGVDIFAAGVERIVERGGQLGIHTWCCANDAGIPADKLVDTHPLHQPYIEYLTEVMGKEYGPLFYFRTIKAASVDDVYIMTEDEMIQSGIATKIIDPSHLK